MRRGFVCSERVVKSTVWKVPRPRSMRGDGSGNNTDADEIHRRWNSATDPIQPFHLIVVRKLSCPAPFLANPLGSRVLQFARVCSLLASPLGRPEERRNRFPFSSGVSEVPQTCGNWRFFRVGISWISCADPGAPVHSLHSAGAKLFVSKKSGVLDDDATPG